MEITLIAGRTYAFKVPQDVLEFPNKHVASVAVPGLTVGEFMFYHKNDEVVLAANGETKTYKKESTDDEVLIRHPDKSVESVSIHWLMPDYIEYTGVASPRWE